MPFAILRFKDGSKKEVYLNGTAIAYKKENGLFDIKETSAKGKRVFENVKVFLCPYGGEIKRGVEEDDKEKNAE